MTVSPAKWDISSRTQDKDLVKNVQLAQLIKAKVLQIVQVIVCEFLGVVKIYMNKTEMCE